MEGLTPLVQSPVFGLVGLLLTVASLAFGFIFYRRSRRAKEPHWAIRSNNLVSSFTARFPQLEIRYGNDKVENLTVSKVLFWNHGTETIDSDDIAEADPVRIDVVDNVQILDVSLLVSNSAPTRFAVTPDARLTFDFLDKNQGGLLQVIHTGLSSGDITLKGTIKGARGIRLRNIKIRKTAQPVKMTISSWVTAFVITGSLVAIVGAAIANAFVKREWTPLLVLASLIAFIVFDAVRNSRLAWVPHGLERYHED